MPGDSLVIRGQIDGPLDAAHQQALGIGLGSREFFEFVQWLDMLEGGSGGQFDFHRDELCSDLQNEVHFQSLLGAPEIEIGPLPLHGKGFEGFTHDTPPALRGVSDFLSVLVQRELETLLACIRHRIEQEKERPHSSGVS